MMSRLVSLCRNLWRRGRVERELHDEVHEALEQLVEERVAAGMGLDAARRSAAIALGGVESVKAQVREVQQGASIDSLLQDARYGVRLLRRSPLLTLTASVSLAVGIGADTAVFTLANALLYRSPVGVDEPERLVDIGRTRRDARPLTANFGDISYPNYNDIRARTQTLESVYGYVLVPEAVSLGRAGQSAERVFSSIVTPNYFSALGVLPAVGRFFGFESDESSPAPAVVLSHRLWVRRFGRDPSIVGQTVLLNGREFAVLGVTAEGFRGTTVLAPDVWIPAPAVPELRGGDFYLKFRERGWLMLGGRLKPGIPVSQAAAELDAIGRALEQEYPAANRDQGLRVAPAAPVPGGFVPLASGFVVILLGLVSLVLLIACANLAGVLLARAAARRGEFAVRSAIGAGRPRLIRQLLMETTLLFVVGGILGLLLARWMTSLLTAMVPSLPVPVDLALPLDGRVLAFTTGLSFLACLLCGMAPAFVASRVDAAAALRGDAEAPPRSGHMYLRHGFVVTQIACSVLLVVCAGLLVQGVWRAGSIDLGFEARNVELAELDLDLAGYTDAMAPEFLRSLLERIRETPGVGAATIAATMPMGDLVFRLDRISVPGAVPTDGRPYFEARWNIVEPGYFDTLSIPLVRGRDFGERDRGGSELVAIVSETAARQFWPGGEALGQSLLLHGTGTSMMSRSDTDPNSVRRLTVVGIVRDVRLGLTEEAVQPFVYLPVQQQPVPRLRVTIAARTSSGQRLASAIQATLASMDPNLPIVTAQTLENQMAIRTTRQRIAASFAGGLGVVGLLLAAIGIYGVTAFTVARRTREIGIRVALGARRGDVVRMVLTQGLCLTAAGAAVGLVLAAAASRLLVALLFGLSPLDPATFVGAALLFVAVGVTACYIPVLRASRINATDALRYE